MNNIFGLLVSLLYVGIIIVSAKVFEKAGKEASRKYIHIMLSNWWIIAMIFFDNMFWAAAAPAIFVIINYLSYKKGIIKVMERDDSDDNKESLGTVYYALSLLILALITFGPLNNPNTNQRLYHFSKFYSSSVGGRKGWRDITSYFWRKKF